MNNSEYVLAVLKHWLLDRIGYLQMENKKYEEEHRYGSSEIEKEINRINEVLHVIVRAEADSVYDPEVN